MRAVAGFTSLASIRPDGTLAWCHLVPESWALSHDAEELVWGAGSKLVHTRIADGAQRVRSAPFPIGDVVFADSDEWLLVREALLGRVHRCGLTGDVIPTFTMETKTKRLVGGNERMVLVYDAFKIEVFDVHWGCVRQVLRPALGTGLRIQHWNDSLVVYRRGNSRVEVHDPWWGGMEEHELGDAVECVHDGCVLIGVGNKAMVVDLENGWTEPAPHTVALWGEQLVPAHHDLPLALAACGVFVLESGEPCFVSDNRILGPKSIGERNTITAITQRGSQLFVGARSVLASHSLERRDHRVTFTPSHAHREWITALCVCGDHVVSVGTDRRVAVWSLEGGLVHERREDAAIFGVASSPRGELVTVGHEGIARIYPDPCKDEHRPIRVGIAHVVAATSNLIAIAMPERFVLVSWNGEPKWDAPAHVGSIAAHPMLDLFAIGTSDGQVMLIRPGEQRVISQGHAPNPSLAFGVHGERLFIGSGTPEHPGSALELELS